MSDYLTLKKQFSDDALKEEKSKRKAIEKAYADMSRRAVGHKPEMKEACVDWLENEVFAKSLKTVRSQDDFDAWHRAVCQELKKRHKAFGTIGRSQKVINMCFKYLSCIDSTYDAVLPYCHMTLDGYTLVWYKTIVPKEEAKEVTEWSKIDDYDVYCSMQKKIRRYLQDHRTYSVAIGAVATKAVELSRFPFEAEFVIWEGEILKKKYNALTKELEQYKKTGRSKDAWLIGDLFDDFLKSYNQ